VVGGSADVLLCAKVDGFALADSFGQGNGTILLDDVSCSSSNYLHLLSCQYSTRISFFCDHSEDVAVYCCKFKAPCKFLECFSFSSKCMVRTINLGSGTLAVYITAKTELHFFNLCLVSGIAG